MGSTASKIPGWYVEFQAALLRQAPRPDQLDQVAAEEWIKNQLAMKKALATTFCPLSEEKTRLTFVASNIIPATTEVFECGGIFAGAGLDRFFHGKVEGVKLETTLYQYQLEQKCTTLELIEALGGDIKAESTLTEIKYLLNAKAHDERSVLDYSRGNIFFVRGSNGHQCSVSVRFWRNHWRLSVCSKHDKRRRFYPGSQVFGRRLVG